MCVVDESFTNETSSKLGWFNMFVSKIPIGDEVIICLHLQLKKCQLTEWHEFGAWDRTFPK